MPFAEPQVAAIAAAASQPHRPIASAILERHQGPRDDGQVVCEHTCKLGLEGIIAKRIDLPYKSGRAKCWIKVRNPKSAAMLRIEDGSW